MKKIKEYKEIIILIFIIILGAFYWFQIRPSQIRKNCSVEAYDSAKGRDVGFDYIENQKIYDTAYNSAYKECLNKNGL